MRGAGRGSGGVAYPKKRGRGGRPQRPARPSPRRRLRQVPATALFPLPHAEQTPLSSRACRKTHQSCECRMGCCGGSASSCAPRGFVSLVPGQNEEPSTARMAKTPLRNPRLEQGSVPWVLELVSS